MSTIHTILGTDYIKDSRADINNNFNNLNTDKLESSQVLTRINTDVYVPTSDYHPATKKYVDDQLAGENLWDRTGTTLVPHNSGDSVSLSTGYLTTYGLTVLSQSGVAKFSAGVISGGATTSDLTEGTNQYFTNSRAIGSLLSGYTSTSGAISASDSVLSAIQKLGYDKHIPVTVVTTNGLGLSGQDISIGLSSTSTNGALSSTDWNTFNNKQPAGTYSTDIHSNITALNAVSGSNTGDESQSTIKTKLGAASSIADGYLISTDWSTFNSKQSALTFGIANTNAIKIDSASVTNGEYAKFTANGLESRSTSEVLSDIGGQASLGFTPENVTNKVTSLSGSSTDTQYPSAKLVYDQLAGKQPTGNYITLTSLSSSATGLTYTNTTGVFSLTSGYVIPTTTEQTNWGTAYTNTHTHSNKSTLDNIQEALTTTLKGNYDTAYSNRITSLTTTGSSGAATLSSNTLNIPTYTLAGLGGQPALNGTGFVKASGTTISYDNSTYLTAETDPLSLHLDQTTPQSIINGKPSFSDGITFGTNPTVGSFLEGKTYYDTDWKTLSANIDTDVNLQIGQEELRRVYNNTASTISNGKAVYTTGTYTSAFPYVATVDLAIANDVDKANVLGITTQDIAPNSYGFITVRGHINNLDTTDFVDGDVLYLSDVTAGDLTSSKPSAPNLVVRVGRCIYSHATLGTLNVRLKPLTRVEDLSDVRMTSITDGQTIVREGSVWVNKGLGQVSAGAGVNIYLDNTATIDSYGGLLRVPDSVEAEQTNTVTFTGTAGTKFIKGYLYNQAEGRTKWDGGTWKFNTYAFVNDADKVSEIISAVYMVQDFGGYPASTITITGTGTSRTATVTGSTPFVAGDYNADQILTSYIQAPVGTFKVSGYTSSSVATITTPSGYTNESGVAFSIHRYKFQATTGEINQLTTPILYATTTVQPEYILPTVNTTLAVRIYGKTTSTKANVTVNYTQNGTSHYSYIETPFVVRHDDLAGLNLTGTNYHHLTTAEYTVATRTATGSLNGLLSSTDWTAFNGKQPQLNGTGFVKTSGTTISYDNSTYLTANQSITLSGAVTGSGTTSISTTLADNTVSAGKMQGASSTKLANGSAGNLLKSLGDGTFGWDTSTYLTSLSGAVLTDQSIPQTIGATGARLTKLWATDITVTNAINGSVTGNAGTVTNGIYTTSDATALAANTANKDKYLHTNASTGALEWSSVAGGGLTVGTTAIASGTTTKVLYDNAGTLGEYTVSGSGNVAMTTSPVFTTPSLGVATATTINNLKIGTGNTTNTSMYNVAIGDSVMQLSQSGGGWNTGVGKFALYINTSGEENTAIGANSLLTNSTGNYNTAIGAISLSDTVGSNNIGLGYFAGRYETGSNAFYVDSRDRTNTAGDKAGAILYGVMSDTPSSQTLTTNSAFTATYGMNIPTGQTYKINNVALTYSDVGALASNGTAAKATVLETTRAIYGNNFDGSAALTQVIASTYGGTGNGFTKFTGPSTAEKTFTLPDANTTLCGIATVQTLTNKRITQRVITTTDDSTAVIDVDVTDVYELSAVANATTFSTTGTPTDGQKLIIRFKDAGVAKGLTWDAIFSVVGVTLPTTTVVSKWHYVGAIYNTAATKWHVMAVGVEA